MQKRSFLLLAAATIVMVAAAVYALAIGDRARQPGGGQPARVSRSGRASRRSRLDAPHARRDDDRFQPDRRALGGSRERQLPGRGRQGAPPAARRWPTSPSSSRRPSAPALFARLGLDDPGHGNSTLVTLQDRTGRTVARLIIGKTADDRLGGGTGAVYVRRPGENRTWLARGSLDLSASIAGWLDRRIVDIADSRVASVTLTGSDGAALVLRRAAAGGKFAVADAPADTKFKDDAALAAPAGALADLDLDDVKPSAELPVPQSGVASASFTTFDGLTVNVRLFAHGKADWIALSASGSGAAGVYATALNTRLAPWIYAIPADRAKLLRTRLADLIAPQKGS